MVKNNFMINTLLKNEAFVKKIEAIAQELEVMKETKGDFGFFLPKLILNIEGLMKMYHKEWRKINKERLFFDFNGA